MTETQAGAQARSVPKVNFTDAEAGAKTFPDSTERRFNYYTPAGRKQTHYEDVTVEVQPDPRHYLSQGWLYGFSDGRGGYPLDWTAGTSSATRTRSGNSPCTATTPTWCGS
jgi:propane monooxygenase small subunit